MTLIVEGFERFSEGVAPAAPFNERTYDGLGVFLVSGVVEPDGWDESKLLPTDGGVNGYFGTSVSISADGNTLIAGSNGDDDKGTNSGSAYIFVRNGTSWSPEVKLLASDGAGGDHFGRSVSISADGNTAIAGSYGDDTKASNSGAAYIFTRSGTTWSQQAKLTASDGATNDQFGVSVSISADGNTAIIGAFRDGDKGNESGSAYIFVRNGTSWSQQAKLVPTDGAAGDRFGNSVSVSVDGNTVIVGSHLDDDKGGNSGSAYIFVRNGTSWSQQAKLVPTDGGASHQFGFSVSISADGNSAIVGSPYDDEKGAYSGSAYIFVRNGTSWSQQTKLVAEDGFDFDSFGYSVSISADSNTAIVGSNGDDDKGSDSGSVYVFTRDSTNWSQKAKITASDGADGDQFGASVSISADGNSAIVGAPYDDDNGSHSGSAYVITMASGAQIDPENAGAIEVSTSHQRQRGLGFNYSRPSVDATAQVAEARIQLPSNAWTKRIVGFGLRVVQADANGYIGGFAPGDSDPTPQTEITVGVSTTAPNLTFGGTDVSTSISVLGGWVYLEIEIDRSSGQADLYVDGELAASKTVNPTILDDIGCFTFQVPTNVGGIGFDVDDFYYQDDVGEADPIERFGPCKIDLAKPISSTVSEFTPSDQAQSNWELVGDTPIEDETYVSSSVEGDYDQHNLSNPLPPEAKSNRVVAVQVQTILESLSGPTEATVAAGVGGSMESKSISIDEGDPVVVRHTLRRKPGSGGGLTTSDLEDLVAGYAHGDTWPAS